MIKKNFLMFSFLVVSLFQINVICKNEISIENSSEFRKDEIEFSNSKEDKQKLTKYVNFMVSEITSNPYFFNDQERIEVSKYVSERITNQCNSILNNGYNLKLSKNRWKWSGFTFSAFTASPSDQKSEIKFYFNNGIFKIEAYENIIAEKYLTNNNDISGTTKNKYIYTLKKPINKDIMNPVNDGFKKMGFDLAKLLNIFPRLTVNLSAHFEKEDGSFGDSITKNEKNGFIIETERCLFKSPWNDLAAKISIEIKKK